MSVESLDQQVLHANRQEQLDKSSLYIRNFLHTHSNSSSYKVSRCPTCGNEEAEVLFIKNNGQYAYCTNCKHIFLKTSLKQEILIDFYKNYPTSSLDWHINESEFYQRIYKSGIDAITASTKKKLLLDIGCSSGYFLSIAKQFGFNTSGIEPNALESSFASEQGINVIGSTIEEIPHSSKFDVITMWDVLEHIDSPVQYLKKLSGVLNIGGIVFVQIPTCDSLAARVLRDKCNMFDGIEHLTLFSSKSLDIAFSQAGYTSINKKTVISDRFAISNYLNYELDPYLPQQLHEHICFDDVLEYDELESLSLGYKIQACYALI